MGAEGTVAAGVVRAQLARVARRVWLGQLIAGLCWWLATLGAAGLILCLGDNVLRLPAAVRLVGSLGFLAGALWEGWRQVIVPWRSRWTPERAARAIEAAQARTDNLLINACQLEAMALFDAEAHMADSVLSGARAIMLGVRAGVLLRCKRLIALSLAAAAVVALWGGYRAAAPDRLGNALERFALPLDDVPPLGSVDIACEPARDVVISEGASLTVAIRVSARGSATPEAPRLAWQEGAAQVALDGAGAEFVALAPGPGHAGTWFAHFANLHRSFAFRALCADSATPSVRVTVAPLPRIVRSEVRIAEPDYAGASSSLAPGPPAAIAALAGSELALTLELDHALDGVAWRTPAGTTALSRSGSAWSASVRLVGSGDGDLVLPDGRVLAHAALVAIPDQPPEVSIDGVDENRLLLPGAQLAVACRASDDHGLASCALCVREGEDGSPASVARWSYLGPPGPRSASERTTLVLDPARFLPGRTYVLEAQARDRCGSGQIGRSRPILLRIRDLGSIRPEDARLGRAIEALKRAISEQRVAANQSDNLAPELTEAIAAGRLRVHAEAINEVQKRASSAAAEAGRAFAHEGDQADSRALAPIVGGDMPAAEAGLDELAAMRSPSHSPSPAVRLARIAERQRAILAALIAILGEAAARPDARATPPASDHEAQERSDARDAVARARDDLKDFLREQERIIARSKTLADVKPIDLSDGQSQALGALAREEAKQAKFLEDKMSDFSKLPTEDFSDAALGKEINQVWQDITEADESLYKKSVQIAVPQEQNGLELAKELENNLEKWMANHQDNVQWAMEEALKPQDVPISELPKQLEDIVGDLLDKEDQMSPDVEDLSSAWMDNIDKGAGWDAADGPISNMSAKGITGNQLPNQDEIGGRSGEGRNGRSHGQMVQDSAEGKGGRETPSRLEPEPFESGSVKDSDQSDHGGPTGGGKVSGAAAEGLRGPVPPPLAHAMARLAGQQAQIRQQAGALALELRRRHLPSGDVENAVAAMQGIEQAAASGRIGAIRQRYAEAVDALRAARDTATAAPASVRRERIDLERTQRDLTQGDHEGVPAGYEEMSSAYFRALSEETR